MQTRILVVDDEPDLEHLIRQKFRKEIRSNELNFEFAQNGQEAIDKLKKDGKIDLVLTDINMPVMDGLTLLTRLADLNLLLKSVIVSAYGDMENIRTAMNRGAFDFVTKPINLQDLETTIKKALNELHTLKEALESQNQLMSIQRELDVARNIQQSIVPGTFPPFPDRSEFEIYGSMNAAKEVGGDFFDFFFIDDDRLGFVIGDVSGKGVPAALFMAVSRTLLKATALEGFPPGECMNRVNGLLYSESVATMFVTIFYGILNIQNGEMQYCNGGHNPPYIIRNDGNVKSLELTGGLVVGALPKFEYSDKKIQLHPGDGIFMYTDGVTEARDIKLDDFEEKRLEECLRQCFALPIDEITIKVVEAVKAFSSDAPQTDDITCLMLRYLGE